MQGSFSLCGSEHHVHVTQPPLVEGCTVHSQTSLSKQGKGASLLLQSSQQPFPEAAILVGSR